MRRPAPANPPRRERRDELNPSASYADWLRRTRGSFESLRVTQLQRMGLSVIRSQLRHAFDDAPSPDVTIQLCVSGARRGTWDVGYGPAAFHLRPGQILVSPAGRPILIDAEGSIGFCGLAFPWSRVQACVREAGARETPDFGLFHNRVLVDAPVRGLTLALRDEVEAGAPSGTLFADALLHAIIARLLHLASLAPQPRRTSRLSDRDIAAIRDYIHDHLAAPIEIADLSRIVHLSSFHFARCFRASVGVSPHEYLLRERISRAQDLLRGSRGQASVADVARAVGFCNSSHLARHFRRIVGVSPSVWATCRTNRSGSDRNRVIDAQVP
ncbi:MAG: AraC family transcriptional regulator [Phycisphaerales bacterium]|nr:AraC family transcriptional regulator [Phycisphaerales bacterium]